MQRHPIFPRRIIRHARFVTHWEFFKLFTRPAGSSVSIASALVRTRFLSKQSFIIINLRSPRPFTVQALHGKQTALFHEGTYRLSRFNRGGSIDRRWGTLFLGEKADRVARFHSYTQSARVIRARLLLESTLNYATAHKK